MTITRVYKSYTLICDVCSEAADDEFDSFDDARQFAKDNGWRIQNRNGEWENICPECAGK